MTLEIWLAFVVATTIVVVIPGPTILTVVSYSILHGKTVAVPLVLAVALGDCTALAVSLVGLGALLENSSTWFTIIKWAGGLYLLYLGITLFFASATTPQKPEPESPDSRWKLFANTWLVTSLNPKGIVFFVAFFPQFLNPSKAVVPQLWIMSITFVVLATINAALYAIFASAANQLLKSPKAQKRYRIAGGSLLSLAGLWALTVRQSA